MKFELNKLHLADCMEGMKTFPDKYFDLAIVDPPYGIGVNKMQLGNGKNKIYRGKEDWDAKPPPMEYFNELRRVSGNQVIWGGNNMTEQNPLNSTCWIVWDKGTGDNDFADCELAYTSFNKTVRIFRYSWVGANAKEKGGKVRIHPTQKPIALYKWILKNYAKPDFKIIDTHVGSGSSIIAFLDYGCDWIGFEIDEDYHKAASERIEIHKQQLKLF